MKKWHSKCNRLYIHTWHLYLDRNTRPGILRHISTFMYTYWRVYTYMSIHAFWYDTWMSAATWGWDCQADRYIYMNMLTCIYIRTWHLNLNSNIRPEILRQIGTSIYTYWRVCIYIHDTCILTATCGQRSWGRSVHLYTHNFIYVHVYVTPQSEQQHVARDCEADQYICIHTRTCIYIHHGIYLYLDSNMKPEILKQIGTSMYTYLHVYIKTWHLYLNCNMWPEILRQIGVSI